MKKTVLLTLLLSAVAANATVTLQTFFGSMQNAAGSNVSDGTLWILVVDGGAAGFAGGFSANSSLTQAGANQAFTTGQSLSVGGLLGSDTIFAMGGVDSVSAGVGGSTGPVFSGPTGLTYGVNGLTAGANYAIYWFPGVTFNSGSATQLVGSQVGGFNNTVGNPDLGPLDGMTLPPDGNTVLQGFATVSAGGTIPDASVRAVTLVPEPTAALLGLLGVVGLVRRRR